MNLKANIGFEAISEMKTIQDILNLEQSLSPEVRRVTFLTSEMGVEKK